jgi:hypothetical protein
MKSSAEIFLSKIENYYENIYNLLVAFQQAQDSRDINEVINVEMKNSDGTKKIVQVNSFQKMQEEIKRIDGNFKNLLNTNNLSYTLNSDGSISKYTRTSFMNAQYINSSIIDNQNIVVEHAGALNELFYPLVKLPITISDDIISPDIHCQIFQIEYGWDDVLAKSDAPTLLDIDYLYNQGKIKYLDFSKTLTVRKTKVTNFGKFSIEEILFTDGNGYYDVVLNPIAYESTDTVGNAIDLKVNDILITKAGSGKYLVEKLDRITYKAGLKRIDGVENLYVGIENLYYNQVIDVSKNIVEIPIKPQQKLCVFLSVEDLKTIGYPTRGILIDTENYTVQYQSKTYSIDEFFGEFVTNFSDYLINMMNEVTIPHSLGIIPRKPLLVRTNFKVVQINKHTSDNRVITDLTTLNKNKQAIQNDITYKEQQILLQENELNTKKFNSLQEKTYIINQISKNRSELIVLKQNLLNIARDLDTNATSYGIKKVNPKFRIIGFWEIQDDLYNPVTGKQRIIKYDVEYRYLSYNLDTTENYSYSMIENGKKVQVSFSSWNRLDTKVLNRISDIGGKLTWETLPLDSADTININQLMISINETESVEIRLRAVTEAGYPLSPVRSEWSEVIRIDFPEDLKENNIQNIISQNEIDLQNAEFTDILNKENLLSHVADRLLEAEKTFQHQARNITSGQFTNEQKNISLDVCISNIMQKLSVLENQNKIIQPTITIIDFNSESYSVLHNSTIELFAGNYCDDYDVLDNTTWGGIVRKKAYIKIQNPNLIAIELRTLCSGNLSDTDWLNTPYPIVPVKFNVRDENKNIIFSQDKKQILYFRKYDINAIGVSGNIVNKSSVLVTPDSEQVREIKTDIDVNWQLSGISDADKNIVYRTGTNSFSTCKLNTSTYTGECAVFRKDHPYYKANQPTLLEESFQNLKKYADISVIQSQRQVSTDYGLGFDEYDNYAVGMDTCGAFLYPQVQSVSSIQVLGNNTDSTIAIPRESEILIPLIFEYRMIDAIGNILGNPKASVNTANQYSKKIGVDMNINNQTFSFDVNVTANLRSKIKASDISNLGSILNTYNSEPKENLN